MGTRRRSREYVVKVLYMMDIRNEFTRDLADFYWESREKGKQDAVREFADRIIDGVVRYRVEIDKLITSLSHHWRFTRISLVDRNILRMALYEMMYEKDIPTKVSIDEAIEIAKTYSTDKSGQYINGILDSAMKKIQVSC